MQDEVKTSDCEGSAVIAVGASFATEENAQNEEQPSQKTSDPMSQSPEQNANAKKKNIDPSAVSFAFSDMNAVIWKGVKGKVLTSEDLLPLPTWMSSADTLRRFDQMMERFVWRVPLAGCWRDNHASSSCSRKNGRDVRRERCVCGACGGLLFTHKADTCNAPFGDAENTSNEDTTANKIKNSSGNKSAAKHECSCDRSAGSALYAKLLSPTADASSVVASVDDRLRLYLSQGYSLTYLLFRFSLYHLCVAVSLILMRTAATVLQVWSLWTVVRIVSGEEEYGEYSSVVQYIVGLCLPLSAFLMSEFGHNVFHVSARSAVVCRSAAITLIFEKLKLITPLHLGAAAAALTPPAKPKKTEGSSGDGTTSEQKDTASATPTPTTTTGAAAVEGISSGKLLNMVSSDANTLIEAFIVGPFTISCVLDIALGVAWIGYVVGWAAAPLCGAMLIMLFQQFWFGDRVRANKGAVALYMDQRLRSLSEFLSGIQVVKFYAWEKNVRRMVGALRSKEATLHVAGNVWKLLGLASIFFVGAIFSLVLFAVKLTYNASMGAGDVFVTMTLIGLTSRGFAMIPRALTGMGTSYASMKRIEAFLSMDVMSGLPTHTIIATAACDNNDNDKANTEGVAPAAAAFPPSSGGGSEEVATTVAAELALTTEAANANVRVTNPVVHQNDNKDAPFRIVGDYGWAGFALRGVDLTCPKGSLTVLVGAVGSGKSTLLQAALGVCCALPPQLTNDCPNTPANNSNSLIQLPGAGRIAYVAQEAFIAEATVRENIVFGLPFDELKYRRVIKACALVTDFQQWGGDLVEVTSTTLSGGQRQRLSLARACYADADLYIVDDPISAVDASVGRHLLRRCFRGYLNNKTVLLATHHPAPARFADQVVLMENGVMRVCPMTDEAKELVRQLTDTELEKEGAWGTRHGSTCSEGSVDNASMASLTAEDLLNAMRRIESADRGDAECHHNDADDLLCYAEAAATADAVKNDENDVEMDEELANTQQDALLDELIGKARELRKVEAEVAGSVSLSVYKAYIQGGGWGFGLITLVLFIAAQGARSVQDWWFSAWTRQEFPELSNDQYLYILGILVAVLVVLSFARTVVFGFFTISASSSLHDRMFEAVIASPLHFFEQVPLGRIMNRFSKDLDYCDDLLPRTLFDFLQNILTIMGSLALLIYSIPWFAIAVPVAFVLFYFLIKAYMPSSRYIKRIEGTSRSPSMNTFQTVMGGLTTLRVYNRLDHFQGFFFKACDVTTNALLHSTCTQRWMGLRMDWIAVGWICVAVVLCIALQDTLGPSLVGLCLSQSLSFTGLLQFAVRMAAETENLMTAVERIDEYGKLPCEENKGPIKVPPLAPPAAPKDANAITILADNDDDGKESDAIGNLILPSPRWPEGCDVVVKGLTMAYASNPTHNVLKDLHFTIKAGQRVAVVGRTGAGKSSLLSAFYRTVEIPEGSIRIGGVSTTDMDVFSMRSRLGIIPQVPTLFHGTFRYNLDPFGLYTDEAMLEALRKVRLESYVQDPSRHGLDTTVGDNGGNLSVGQRQLLCAARVLLTGASILFMDEATANIDEETDAQIQQIIREEASRRQMTVITIAHRLNTIMDYDLVLVMSQGRLVEYGNPQELVAKGPLTTVGDGFDDESCFRDNGAHTEGGTSVADKSTHADCLGEEDTSVQIARAVAEQHRLQEGGVTTECVVSTVSPCGGFTTNISSIDEIRQFSKMVQAMHEAHNEH